jgi:hypothetical protein
MKTYIIREANFEYDDSRYANSGTNNEILHTLHDEGQARKAYLRLERERYAEETLDFYYTQTPTEGEHPWDKLAHYIEKEFGIAFQSLVGLPHNFWAKTTDDQMAQILAYTGLRFYVLTAFENEPIFYKIVTEDTNMQREEAYKIWHQSYQEAFEAGLGIWVDEIGDMAGYGGDLEQMTEAPHLLRAYLQNCTCLLYDEEMMTFKMKDDWRGWSWGSDRQERETSIVEVRGLWAMLTEKPFTIEKIVL